MLPMKRRTFDDHIGLLDIMDDVHCFECSDVLEAAKELAADLHKRPNQIGRLAFLPAPKTWIEWREEDGRIGILLRELKSHKGEPVCAHLYYALDNLSWEHTGMLELVGLLNHKPNAVVPLSMGGRLSGSLEEKITTYLLYALLAMINTPRLIGRRQHMPHRGLERDLTRAMKPIGKYPLHAWTEIKLEVGRRAMSQRRAVSRGALYRSARVAFLPRASARAARAARDCARALARRRLARHQAKPLQTCHRRARLGAKHERRRR